MILPASIAKGMEFDCVGICDASAEAADASLVAARRLATAARVVVVVACILSAAVGLFLGLTMSKGIVDPISEMQDASHELAAGDLNVQIDYQSKDALGVLADNMRHMTGAFHDIIQDVEDQLEEMSKGNFASMYTGVALFNGEPHDNV